MIPGGCDITLDVSPDPDALPFILQWWTALWPQAYIESEGGETFVWFNWRSRVIENVHNLVHVILTDQGVTLVVDFRDVHFARKCLDRLASYLQIPPDKR